MQSRVHWIVWSGFTVLGLGCGTAGEPRVVDAPDDASPVAPAPGGSPDQPDAGGGIPDEPAAPEDPSELSCDDPAADCFAPSAAHVPLPAIDLGGGLYAYNPHRPRAGVFLGSGHTHAAPDHSQMDPVRQEEWQRDGGFDFVWLTAHSFVAPDPGVEGVTHLFGAEIYSSKLPESGNELHLLAFLPDDRLASTSARPWGQFQLSVDEVAAEVSAAGGVTVLAHPSRYSPTLNELAGIGEGLWGMEGVSGATDPAQNLHFVDARLSAGHYTCISAGADIHAKPEYLTWGFQAVAADSADREALTEAVYACNFFACRTDASLDDYTSGLELAIRDGAVVFSAAAVQDEIRFVGRDGRELARATDTASAAYAPTAADGYVRVEARRAQGDALCVSQPVWLFER